MLEPCGLLYWCGISYSDWFIGLICTIGDCGLLGCVLICCRLICVVVWVGVFV